MDEKSNIIDAWIMIEHLSEGDIKLRDKDILTLSDLNNRDYYSLFKETMAKKKIDQNKNGGIVIYFDVFNFNEVIKILRDKYHLKPTDEETESGYKFSYALCFSKNLEFVKDLTFFTASGYIRYKKELPKEKKLNEIEEDLKNRLEQLFDTSEEDPDKINEAFNEAFCKLNTVFYKVMGNEVKLENCRMQVLKNVETELSNLHSFFINDLQNVKLHKMTKNVKAYLYGNQKERFNLDSKRYLDDGELNPNFDPEKFNTILMPKNYPLGRFPSNTKYALSFMQQVAVNLSTGADTSQMRSVNGPPGTGKTTLLKDIFAELVVQQAHEISKLKDPVIKPIEKMVDNIKLSLSIVPQNIRDNNILVASSNNAAVQNIVNELPKLSEIDEDLKDELIKADYFYYVANGIKEEDDVQTLKDNAQFWGLFSFEGGKSDNMYHLIGKVYEAMKYFEESKDFTPEYGIYKKFLKEYKRVDDLRNIVQNYAELTNLESSYEQNLHTKEQEKENLVKSLEDNNHLMDQEIANNEKQTKICNEKLDEVVREKETVTKFIQMMGKRPSFLSRKRAEYDETRNNKLAELDTLNHSENEYHIELTNLSESIQKCNDQKSQNIKRINDTKSLVDAWKKDQKEQMEVLRDWLDQQSEKDAVCGKPIDFEQSYEDLQLSNPWFTEEYRKAQSHLFVLALRVRKQFLYDNKRHVKFACKIWGNKNKYLNQESVLLAAWDWLNLTIPVISSTFSSIGSMCVPFGKNSLGQLFIDEAGQALPQASVGAIYRCKNILVVGDPSQIKPVLTLDSNVLIMIKEHYQVSSKYIDANASTQTLVDAASPYGFYKNHKTWIGIPLWVHRRCKYPMFDIANAISYEGFMVQGKKDYGKSAWYDIRGKANNKFVQEQADFLVWKLKQMIENDPAIVDKNNKDVVYVISPFRNVAYHLSRELKKIGFTRYSNNKPTNVGTIHTFQGKEAPIVFLVLGADAQCSGAAHWAVSEANMMNVAATRAKEEFYVIGDKNLYLKCGPDIAGKTYHIIDGFNKKHPEFAINTDEEIERFRKECPTKKQDDKKKREIKLVLKTKNNKLSERIVGTVTHVGKGKNSYYAYIRGTNGIDYRINENEFSQLKNNELLIKGNQVSFIPVKTKWKIKVAEIELVE